LSIFFVVIGRERFIPVLAQKMEFLKRLGVDIKVRANQVIPPSGARSLNAEANKVGCPRRPPIGTLRGFIPSSYLASPLGYSS
jgi:hypothetical protein